MSVTIRQLGPADETALALLAREDPDFDIPGRGVSRAPLDSVAAQAYLSDPAVLHWIAEEGSTVVGFLYCHHLRKRAGEGSELLLYEIGVRKMYRRQSVGRALLETMQTWMETHRVSECWVLADNPGAVEFYRACSFTVPAPPSVYMTYQLPSRP